jgi:hypothetical protein
MPLAISAEASHKRQLQACLEKMSLPATAVKNVVPVAETISGMLPIAARSRLTSLIQDPNVKVIHVESCRAVARKSIVAEALFELSKAFNTMLFVQTTRICSTTIARRPNLSSARSSWPMKSFIETWLCKD